MEFDVELSQTVRDLKEQIAAKQGIPAEQLCLVCDGKSCIDDKELSTYNVYEGCTVYLVINLRGG